MPLLRRQAFVKQKPPANLTPDEEVFHCKLTNEIFRDYEQFFERIILCNSLVWTCSLTGKAGLTYQEAIECEDKARKQLSTFPDYLQRPVLLLVTLTHRARLADVNDDVFLFAKERYFVGELLETVLDGDRKQCRVVKVLPPYTNPANGAATDTDSDSDIVCLDDPQPAKSPKGKSPHKPNACQKGLSKDAAKSKAFGADPNLFRYVLQETKKSTAMHMVDANQISRKKGLFTRDKCKLYVKQHCDAEDDGVWKVKGRYIKKFKLNEAKFDEFFAGPRPAFAVSKVKKKPKKKENVIDLTGEDEAIKNMKNAKRGRTKKNKEEKEKKKKKLKENSPLAADSEKCDTEAVLQDSCDVEKASISPSNSTKKNSPLAADSEKCDTEAVLQDSCDVEKASISPSNSTKSKEKSDPVQMNIEEAVKCAQMSIEEKAAYREKIKAERLAVKEAKKKQWEEEKLKRKEERELEREKKREEKRVLEENLRERNRPRDDMECDDLKDLPLPSPVQLGVPGDVFGDIIVIVEFLNSFSALFDMHEEFPEGITLKSMIKSLTSTEVNGLFFDVLKFLLMSVFHLNEEENEEVEQDGMDENDLQDIPENCEGVSSSEAFVRAATIAAQRPQLSYSTALSKLHLDSFTISEILRLHFLSSGAKGNESNIRFRHQQRGAYTSTDDAGLEFRRSEPDIIKHLANSNVFDLGPAEKLKVLVALVNQLLTYVSCRDQLEDNYEKLRQIRYELRMKQAAEQRRERDEAQYWYRKRLDAKKKAREELLRIDELRKQAATEGKDFEQLVKDAGLTLPDPNEKKKKTMEDPEEKNKSANQSRETSPAPERRSVRQKDVKDRELDDKDIPEENIDWEKVTEEDKERWQRKFAEKEKELTDLIGELQSGYSIQPIGRDRTFRRYWIFRHLDGIFVEDQEEYIPDDFLQPVSQKVTKNPFHSDNLPLTSKNLNQSGEEKSTSSDKENEVDGNIKINSELPRTENALEASIINGPARHVDKVANGEDLMEVDEKSTVMFQNVHEQISQRNQVRWAYYSSPAQLDLLIESLNPRGYREGPLRQTLIEQKTRLVESLQKCPVGELNVGDESQKSSKHGVRYQSLKSRNRAIQGAVRNESAEELLELNLRETLLDLDERIYAGSLGFMKVKNRQSWRAAMENGNYNPQCDVTWPGKLGEPINKEQGNRDVPMETDGEDDEEASPVVMDLAKALLQIFGGVERKYLNPPLGEDVQAKKSKQKGASRSGKDKNKKDKSGTPATSDDENDEKDEEKRSKPPLERWETSLASCTSLSQVFIHLSILESSISWSKSALHAQCRICRRKGDGEHMLLCDSCDRGHHMYCLKPAVKNVPRGDWFCPDCRPKEVMRTPRKQRRKSMMEESSEEEAEASSDEELDSSEEEDEDGDDSSEEEEEDSSEDDDEDSDEEESNSDEEEEEEEEKEPPKIKFLKTKKQPTSGRSTPTSVRSGRSSRQNTPRETTPVESRSSRSQKKADLDTSYEKPAKKSRQSVEKPSTSRKSLDKGPKIMSKSKSNTKLNSSQEQPRSRSAKRARSIESDDDTSPAKKVAATKSRGGEQYGQMKLCEKLVHELADHEDAWPFLAPVIRREVPDYYEIVKKPMDFQTMKIKINKLEYEEPADVLEDLRLIFANCEEYNVPTAKEYKAGQRLCCLFVQRVKAMKLDAVLVQKGERESASKNSPREGSSRRSRRT